MRPRTLLWAAAGLGGAAVAALVLAGLTAPHAALPSVEVKSPEALAQDALERELNASLQQVGVQDIEQLLLSAR